LGALLLAFLWRMLTSVQRGAGQRDQKILPLLDPIAAKLSRKEAASKSEVLDVAKIRHARPLLYQLLSHFGASSLFPTELLSATAQAEALLAYWMMHPNELQEAPEEMQPEEVVRRKIDGQDAEFHVLRYRMRPGHWAGADWLLGVAGPFFDGDPPFSGRASAFARVSDTAGSTKASELVDWYVGMVQRMSA
jgi:hypothetical protein